MLAWRPVVAVTWCFWLLCHAMARYVELVNGTRRERPRTQRCSLTSGLRPRDNACAQLGDGDVDANLHQFAQATHPMNNRTLLSQVILMTKISRSYFCCAELFLGRSVPACACPLARRCTTWARCSRRLRTTDTNPTELVVYSQFDGSGARICARAAGVYA